MSGCETVVEQAVLLRRGDGPHLVLVVRGAVDLVGRRATGQALPLPQAGKLGMVRVVVERAAGELADVAELGGVEENRGGELAELVGQHGLEQGPLVDEVLVRAFLVDAGLLGDAPTPVPEPLASLLLAYVADRPNMTTAANPDSHWLFPGCRAGQAMHPGGLRDLLRKLDVPAQRGRITAIRQLVLQMPAPVVAQALGYHHNSTTRIAAESGSP